MRPIDGIHHISAITGDARRNVAFYTGTLGLRLVAKSVNQDDPSVYHLFYGDETADPGADLTFFEYPGAVPGRVGAGMVHRIVWRIDSVAALDFWQQRLNDARVDIDRDETSLRFADFEGLRHELAVTTTDDPPLIANHPEIPAQFALQGFAGIRVYSRAQAASEELLQQLLGAQLRDDRSWELRGDMRGAFVAYDPAPEQPGNQSAGVVHHVAFAVRDDAEQNAWLEALTAAGLPNSGKVDRSYFMSLYFREPGGVLYELATEGPGFTIDGPVETFGTRIILPPQFEPHREAIEAHLTPLPDPRADWPSRESVASSATAGAH